MTPQLSMLHLLLVSEGILTLFLILTFSTIVRSYQGQNAFFRWWVQAWLAFAVFLGASALAFQFPESSPVRLLLATVATVAGFLEPIYLFYGASSFANPDDQGFGLLCSLC